MVGKAFLILMQGWSTGETGGQIKLKAILLSLSPRWLWGQVWQSLSQVPSSTPTQTNQPGVELQVPECQGQVGSPGT